MKNFLRLKAICKIAGIIAMVAVIGFSMTACDDGSSNTVPRFSDALAGNGDNSHITWKNDVNNKSLSFYHGSSNVRDSITSSPSDYNISGALYGKNGDTYTCKKQGDNTEFSFTAVVGSDGKLTISNAPIIYFPDGTYTKQ